MATIFETVEEEFNDAKAYAEKMKDALLDEDNGYLTTLANEAKHTAISVDSSAVSYAWPEPGVSHSIYSHRPNPPLDAALTIDESEAPAFPDIDELVLSDIPSIPALTAVAPVLAYDTAPDATLPEDPGSEPTVTDPREYLPSSISESLPTPPTISAVSVPNIPTVTTYAFTASRPTYDLNPPTTTFFYDEAEYQSDLHDALSSRIKTDIEDGTTGVSATEWDTITGRAESRKDTIKSDFDTLTYSRMEAMGWTVEADADSSYREEVNRELGRLDDELNDQVTINETDMKAKHRRFSLAAGVRLEAQVRKYASEVANRAFESAKAAADYTIAIFNAQVLDYNARVAQYLTDADVLEQLTRAALTDLELWREQLEGATLSVELQGKYLSIYEKQLQGVSALGDLYRTHLAGAEARAKIDRLRLQQFRLKIDLMMARIEGETAKYNMARAEISAESEKAKGYSEMVAAYDERIKAIENQIAIIEASAEYQSLPTEQDLKVYSAKVVGYRNDIEEAAKEVETLVDAYGIRSQAYGADVNAANADLASQVQVYGGRMQRARYETMQILKQADLDLAAYKENRRLCLDALNSGAMACAQIAASALSSVNANAGTSAGSHVGKNESETTTTSTSTGVSYVEQHIYEE